MPNISLNNLPHTVEGAKLILTKEQEEYCRVVYKLDEKGGAVFSGFWNPAVDYADDYVIAPLRSTYRYLSPTEYPVGTVFSNVTGSSNDKPDNNPELIWYYFIKGKLATTGYASSPCCADSKIYDPSNDAVIAQAWIGSKPTKIDFSCGGHLVGGHVLMDVKNAASVLHGSDVELLPICSNHNIAHISQYGHWGTGYYMKLGRAMKTIIMKGYVTSKAVELGRG